MRLRRPLGSSRALRVLFASAVRGRCGRTDGQGRIRIERCLRFSGKGFTRTRGCPPCVAGRCCVPLKLEDRHPVRCRQSAAAPLWRGCHSHGVLGDVCECAVYEYEGHPRSWFVCGGDASRCTKPLIMRGAETDVSRGGSAPRIHPRRTPVFPPAHPLPVSLCGAPLLTGARKAATRAAQGRRGREEGRGDAGTVGD